MQEIGNPFAGKTSAVIPSRCAPPFLIDGVPTYVGKVRDNSLLGPDAILSAVSGRFSSNDFVIASAPKLGMYRNIMAVAGKLSLENYLRHDMVAYGAGIDEFIPEAYRGNPELQACATILRPLSMIPVEFVYRSHLTGSGYRDYKETGELFGVRLPEGMRDGEELPEVMFTPTTKETGAHDAPMSPAYVWNQYPDAVRAGFAAFLVDRTHCDTKCYLVQPDTKYELGYDSDGQLRFGDENRTVDCARFWDIWEWSGCIDKGQAFPRSLSKEALRIHVKELLAGRDPANPEDIRYVHEEMQLAPEFFQDLERLYRYMTWRLVGMKAESYLREMMGVFDPPEVRVDVLVGSPSDEKWLADGLDLLRKTGSYGVGLVCSAHRNPDTLSDYARNESPNVVVCAGSKALALPGDLRAQFNKVAGKKNIPVIGVALEGSEPEDIEDAVRAIAGLPGLFVEMDSVGLPYQGANGFLEACRSAVYDEFYPRPIKDKPSAPISV